MHAIFFLKHSRAGDLELRFALRGLARHAPWIEKVWVFGDRPHFMSVDTKRIEHVSHELVARVGHFKTPVTNFFLLFYLSSLIPELAPEYLWFCDDFVLLDELSYEDAKRDRYLEDLSQAKTRGQGLWKDSLWRTSDLLRRLGHSTYNFETHVPTYYTKRRVLEAYCDFKDYITEDRWQGMLGPTAILNHAYAREKFPLTQLAEEGRHVGFHHGAVNYETLVHACAGKTFLNFDDDAFDGNMRRFLEEQLPESCVFERTERKQFAATPAKPAAKSETVMFALELGGGWGHIGVIQPLAKELVDSGRNVVIATPQTKVAAQLLGDLPVTIVSAPTPATPLANSTPVRSFAEVLGTTSFQSIAQLTSATTAWRLLLDHYRPDKLICDHAPTPLLASRGRAMRRFVLGQGFTIPDAVSPMPDWRPKLGNDRELVRQAEAQTLDMLNGWLANAQLPLLARVADLYHELDGQILATLPELDPYAPRQTPTTYYNIWPAVDKRVPLWPTFAGRRVLAYLKPSKALPVLLEQLRRLQAASLVICPGIDPKLAALCNSTRVRIEIEPVDLPTAFAACDLAIGNGTHGFTTGALLAGQPQLMLPSTMEQRLTCQRVQQFGAGLIGDPREGKDTVLKLRTVWEQPNYAAAAQSIAQRYNINSHRIIDSVLALINGEISSQRASSDAENHSIGEVPQRDSFTII